MKSASRKRIKPKVPGRSWCVVVGVVADVRHWGADVVIEPTAYYPYTQVPNSMRSLIEAHLREGHPESRGLGFSAPLHVPPEVERVNLGLASPFPLKPVANRDCSRFR